MKSIKKIISYFFVVIIVFCCNDNVLAAHDAYWPDYPSEVTKNIKDYYCSYNIGQLLDYNTVSYEGTHYANKLIYLTYYKGQIYYIHPGNKYFEAGKYRQGDTSWDKDWANQKIVFDSDSLKKDLVNSNGTLTCKNLYFYESSDNLYINTHDDHFNGNHLANQTPPSPGSLMYKGENMEKKCSELSNQIKQVSNVYQTDAKNNAINGLKELSSQSTYQLGDAQKAKDYYDSFMTIYDDAFAKFKDLNLATEDNNLNFNIKQCDAVDSSISASYESLKTAFQNDLENIKLYFEKIIELNTKAEQQAKNSGNIELANQIASERSILDGSQKEVTQIVRQYESFIENMNLGNLGDIVDTNCEGILGEDLLDYIDKIFTWIKIAVPIIVVVLGSLDFGQAVLLDDKDALRKATSKFTKRCIIAVAIFFIPSLLSYILHFFNAITSTGGVSTCGIG